MATAYGRDLFAVEQNDSIMNFMIRRKSTASENHAEGHGAPWYWKRSWQAN
jgi:hypothetical protein